MCESIAKRRGRWQDVSMPRRTNQIMKAHGILIYRHFGSLNRGNEAIVRGTSSLLKEICGPELRIRVASRAPREDQRVFLPAVDAMMGIGNPWSGHPLLWRLHAAVEWRLRKPEHRVVWDSLQTLRWARRSDVCLSVGGDLYCYNTSHYSYPLQRIMRRLTRKMVLWGCSIEPDRVDEPMLADLRRFDLITARESITLAALRDKGLLRVRWYPDSAFLMEEDRQPLPAGWRDGQMVGLNVSPLIESYESQPGASLTACRELVRHILDHTDMGVVLVPHVTKRESDDQIPLRKIWEAFAATGRVFALSGDLNAPQIKGYISRCRFFVGARTHATIAAYSTGVPTLVLGYSVKARGIARDLFGNEQGLVLPVQDLTEPRLLVRLFAGLQQRETALRAHLAAVLPGYIRAAREAGWEICRLLHE